jgi:hypothetical protein
MEVLVQVAPDSTLLVAPVEVAGQAPIGNFASTSNPA